MSQQLRIVVEPGAKRLQAPQVIGESEFARAEPSKIAQ